MMKLKSEFYINKKLIGKNQKTYFIADIAANHDGELERAIELIHLCAEAGADAAKFQHFTASTIVSDKGFRDLGGQQSHQASWKKSVYEVYADASLNNSWTPILKETCDKAGIEFLTSPYSFDLVDSVDPFILAYKVGSGDITWTEIIEHMAKKNKPMLIASGASTLDDVVKAIESIAKHNSEIVLMQCNTNYTASLENFKYINLNVLRTYAEMFPEIILGLSDHTPGHATVLGSVALGARVIEKHFTDDNSRVGPDHKFSMNPSSWKEMVDRTRELELSIGTGVKRIEDNEKETVILQRRAVRAKVAIERGMKISANDVEVLRPCPIEGIAANYLTEVLNKVAAVNIVKGDIIKWSDLR